MENITIQDILEATDGTLLCGDPSMKIDHLSTNSMEIGPNTLFVPIIGERVDAHIFIPNALKDEINDKVTGLDIGADDYITKPFAIQELLARIRATLRKHNNSTTKPAEEPSVFKFKNIHVYLDRHEVKVHNQLVELTKKEYDLLLYLLHNHDHVLSREQILQSIWGYEYMGDTNVVDVYIRYLRAKIDDYFNEKYIHTVRGIGYVIKT